MVHKEPPFKPIVDRSGYYTQKYINWAIQRNNFVDSSLERTIFSDTPSKTFFGIEYIDVSIEPTKEKAEHLVKEIIKLGGLARFTKIQRNKKPAFVVWFNPDGSMKAFDWVSGW